MKWSASPGRQAAVKRRYLDSLTNDGGESKQPCSKRPRSKQPWSKEQSVEDNRGANDRIECNLICFVWRTQPWSKFSLVQTNQIAFDYENIGSIQFTCAWWDKTSTRCYVVCTPVCWWYSEFLVGSSTGETRHTAHVGLCCCRFYIARWIFSKNSSGKRTRCTAHASVLVLI